MVQLSTAFASLKYANTIFIQLKSQHIYIGRLEGHAVCMCWWWMVRVGGRWGMHLQVKECQGLPTTISWILEMARTGFETQVIPVLQYRRPEWSGRMRERGPGYTPSPSVMLKHEMLFFTSGFKLGVSKKKFLKINLWQLRNLLEIFFIKSSFRLLLINK